MSLRGNITNELSCTHELVKASSMHRSMHGDRGWEETAALDSFKGKKSAAKQTASENRM